MCKVRSLLTICIISTFSFIGVLHAGSIYVNGHITQNTTWSNTGNTYVLNGHLYIDSGVTLIISPNVVVSSPSGYSLNVSGILSVNGANLTPPVSVKPGGQVNIADTTMHDKLTFNSGSTGTITDSVIHDSVYLYGGIPTITNCTFTSTCPFEHNYNDLDSLEIAHISGNTYPQDALFPISGTLTRNRTLYDMDGLAYVLNNGSLSINSNATLTISPNVKVTWQSYNYSFEVSGILSVNGANLTPPVSVKPGGQVNIADTTMHDKLTFNSGSTGTITDSVIHDSVYLYGGIPTITNCTFTSTCPFEHNYNDLDSLEIAHISGNTYPQDALFPISGTLTRNRTLYDMDGLAYVLNNGSLSINSNATLTISPNVKVTWQSYNYSFEVSGILSVNGANLTPPVSVKPGGQVNIADTTMHDKLTFNSGSTGTITDSVIHDSVYLYGGIPTITNCTFTSNTPFSISDPDYLENANISGNTYPWNASISIYGTLNRNRTLYNMDGLLYRVYYNHLTIATGATLTIPSHVNVSTPSGYSLNVSGVLSVNGANLTVPINVNTDGQVAMVGTTLQSSLSFNSGSTGTVRWSKLGSLTIHSNSSVSIVNNDLSVGYVSLIGDSNKTINIEQNWWGTTDASEINTSITDQKDNPTLPRADFDPYRYFYQTTFMIFEHWPFIRTDEYIDYIKLSFNEDVDLSTFSPNTISLIGPNGKIPVTTIVPLGDSIYRISLAETLTEGTYSLAVASSVKDTKGHLLNQDGDLNYGETDEDIYRGTFIVDHTGPQVVLHSPDGDIAGTIESLDVYYSEKLYLPTVNPTDFIIQTPNGTIPVNQVQDIGNNSYRLFFAPQTALGIYSIIVKPTMMDIAGNLLDQNGNGIQGEDPNDYFVGSFNLADVDLEISNVAVTGNELWAGQPATIAWDGANSSGMELRGSWTDAVYISSDEQWDINDELLAVVEHSGGLATGQTYSQSVAADIPGRLPGTYYIIIQADLFNQEKGASLQEENNIAVCGPIALHVSQLPTDGSVIDGVLAGDNHKNYYQVDGYSSSNIAVTLDNMTKKNNLSFKLSYESIPLRAEYDKKSQLNPMGLQQAVIGSSLAGQYFVEVSGEGLSGVTPYHISTIVPDVVIDKVHPSKHGDSVNCILTITGGGFTDESQVHFEKNGGGVFEPITVHYLSPTVLTVETATTAWGKGLYDVTVNKPGGATFTQQNAFEITSGEANLKTNIVMPDSMGFSWFNTIYVEYENTGQSSMPAPALNLHLDRKALLTTDAAIRDSLRLDGSIWNNPPATVSDTIQVMPMGSGATPNILQPGDKGRIPVYYTGLTGPWDRGNRTVNADLTINNANNTSIVEWQGYKEQMKPVWLTSQDAWDAIWENFVAPAGNSWGEYALYLNQMRKYSIVNFGGPIELTLKSNSEEIKKMLSLAFWQAAGLSPFDILSESVDVEILTPGLPLSFSRVYQQPINSRYQLGSLGRGWRHNWQIALATNSSGDVYIYDATGTPRIFYNNGGYKPSQGDNGALTYSNGAYTLTEKNGFKTAFNSNGTLNYIEDTNGNRITATYTGTNLTSITHSNGSQIILTYAGNRIVSVTNYGSPGTADDYRVQYDYDISQEYLTQVAKPINQIISYTYETSGTIQQRHALKSVQWPNLNCQYFSYANNGWLASVNRSNNTEQLTFSYDQKGGVTVTDNLARKKKYTFDWTGRPTQIQDSKGDISTIINDNNGNPSCIVLPDGRQYRYEYNNQGKVVTLENALHKKINIAYEDVHSYISSITDPRGNNIRYSYDSKGNISRITNEDDSYDTFTYDSQGNMKTWMNRRGQTITYTYNNAGQVTSKDYDTTPILDHRYTYDSAGNITSMVDSHGATTMTYSLLTNLLTRIDYPDSKYLVYQYNSFGRCVRRTDQQGYYINYVYDAFDRLDLMTDPNDNSIVDYDYDSSGWLSRKTLGNGTYTTFSYDQSGKLVNLTNYAADSSIISYFIYTYDSSGLRISQTTNDGTIKYMYDANGHLLKETSPDNSTVEYVYDSAGNRIRQVKTSAQQNMTQIEYVTNNLNQYTQVGQVAYTYDMSGNISSKTEGGATTTFTYDTENRITQISTPADIYTYAYDGLGNKIFSTQNGVSTNYVNDPLINGMCIAEYNDNDNLMGRCEYGSDGLVSQCLADGNTRWYHYDAGGSTRQITDESGTVTYSADYDTFGVIVSSNGSGSYDRLYKAQAGFTLSSSGMYDSDGIGYLPETDCLTVAKDTIADFNKGYGNASNIVSALEFGLRVGIKSGFSKQLLEAGLTSQRFKVLIEANDIIGKFSLGFGVSNYLVNTAPNYISGKIASDELFLEWSILVRDSFLVVASKVPGLGFPLLTASVIGNFAGNTIWELQQWITNGPGFSGLVQAGRSFIRQSFDPNRKIGPSGHGVSGFISNSQLMTYMIEFENMSTATAPAHIISVTDNLDESLDLSTFELTEVAFANQTITIPSGQKEYKANYVLPLNNESVTNSEITVQIDIKLDIPTRKLSMTLIGVDPQTGWLPENILLGILYPNDDTHRGDGHLSYLVKLNNNLSSGTEIKNKASIIFDWNDPIETPLVVHTIDSELPQSNVNPLPAKSKMGVAINWIGSDISGILYYDIYVSMDNGDYEIWRSKDPNTTAVFNGQPGHIYAFYSIAYDILGNKEAAPSIPDTFTRIYYPSDFDLNDVVDIADLITLANQWLGTPGTPSADIAPTPPDGKVDMLDFSKFAQDWLIGTP